VKFRATEAGHLQVRNMNLRKFGITQDDYETMEQAQHGLCAACGRPEQHPSNGTGIVRLAVDHDHVSGVTRSLLCMDCNRSLGLLGDDLDRIVALLHYRRQWSTREDRWYISGPMTSQPNWNFDNFARKTTELRALGRVVISPHEHDLSLGFDPTSDSVLLNWYANAMSWDIGVLLTCRGAYFLDGYEQSKGAVTEHAIAVSLGLEREYEVPPDPRHFWYSPVAAGAKR
jgi:hypothetical protein